MKIYINATSYSHSIFKHDEKKSETYNINVNNIITTNHHHEMSLTYHHHLYQHNLMAFSIT